jgi:hypothetical protein
MIADNDRLFHGVENAVTAATLPKPEVKWDDLNPEPVLDPAALYGLVGDIINALAAHTEASVAALLFQFLVIFGAMIGRGPFVRVGAVRHEARIFSAIVGATGKARKGQSLAEVRQIFAQADAQTLDAITISGLSTGEGLVSRLSDRGDSQGEKRGLIQEAEFSKVLSVIDNSTLSQVLRDAYDGAPLRVLTRKDPLEADDAYLALIGHSTVEELVARLTTVEIANGFANRILFVWVHRSRFLPDGGSLKFETVVELGKRVSDALTRARKIGVVRRSPSFSEAWHELYSKFPDEPGLAGAIVARGEAHTLRLSLIFALLDGSDELTVDHLCAAYAVWQYAEDSARFIFGNRLGDDIAQRILDEARAIWPEGLDRTQQSALFARNANTARLQVARERLVAQGLVAEQRDTSAKGPPRLILFAIPRGAAPQRQSPLADLLARKTPKARSLF